MIVIIDYGVGNIGSIVSMLNKIGVEVTVSADPTAFRDASKIILPGIGSFDKAMNELQTRNLIAPLQNAVLEQKKPLLGICLGAQILGLSSEEGTKRGLGWIDMTVKRFPNLAVRVPHMGWNTVKVTKQSLLFEQQNISEERFYFTHSFYMSCRFEENVIAQTYYGENFASAVNRDNIYGVQFHPEKSHRFGFNLLSKFANA